MAWSWAQRNASPVVPDNPLPEWNEEWGGYAPPQTAPAGSNAPPGYTPYMDPAEVARLQAIAAAKQVAPTTTAKTTTAAPITTRTSTSSSTPSKPRTTTSSRTPTSVSVPSIGSVGEGGLIGGMTGSNASAAADAIRALLGTPQTIDQQELYRSPEASAMRLQAQRAEERQRAQLAERDAAQGFSASGGFEGSLAGLRQQRGETEAGFMGEIAIRKMEDNKQRLMEGIRFAMNQNQFELAQKLSRDLANLNASIERARISTQASIAAKSLSESGRQFDLGLGFNYDDMTARYNQAATNALLGLF